MEKKISRISARFAALKAQDKTALIPFLMAGDPSLDASFAIADAVLSAGCDLLEIGMPFSDPMADGPVIQAAGLRALKSGTTLKSVLEMVRKLRVKHADTPIILMGYYNPIYRFGGEAFCKEASKAGADGLILVDLPPEEEGEFKPFAEKAGLDVIRLITPTSTETRLPALLESASGFLYYVSVTGITGAASADTRALAGAIGNLRKSSDLPIAAGFGIKTPAQAAETANIADAVVIGSALVQRISVHGDNAQEAAKEAADFIAEMKKAISQRLC